MPKFSVSVYINRSQQDVFDFLTNPANLSRWNSVFESAQWMSGDTPGVGSTYKVLARMPGGKKEGLFEITRWDPPYSYGYRSIRLAFPIESIESAITLAPNENGTQLTFESRFGLAGVLKFAESTFGKLSEKGDRSNLETAKRLLEAG